VNVHEYDLVYYITNGTNNSQYTRERQYKHILIATGDVAKLDILPKTMQMFNIVIAPSVKKAKTWINALEANNKLKIVTIASYCNIVDNDSSVYSDETADYADFKDFENAVRKGMKK
jgi:hypothetical protein